MPHLLPSVGRVGQHTVQPLELLAGVSQVCRQLIVAVVEIGVENHDSAWTAGIRQQLGIEGTWESWPERT